jgi:hypothetical protein
MAAATTATVIGMAAVGATADKRGCTSRLLTEAIKIRFRSNADILAAISRVRLPKEAGLNRSRLSSDRLPAGDWEIAQLAVPFARQHYYARPRGTPHGTLGED